MVYEADTLRDILFTNWALSGRLAKSGTADSPRPVFFVSYEQIRDKIDTKAVEVIKITSLKSERKSEFFTTETDIFEIGVRLKRYGTGIADIEQSEADAEDMETEIRRILDTVYNPYTGVGIFFTADFVWDNRDDINNDKQNPVIYRVLRLSLFRIRSRSNNVFDSFQRGVIFDLSGSSNMNTPPGGDFSYTEVFEVEAFEGFSTIGVQVNNHPDGKGVPLLYDGGFGGTIVMKSYLRSDDIGSSADKINQIYKRQTNGEKPEVALVRTYTNNNSETLTKTTIVRIIETREAAPSSEGNALLTWQFIGKIIKPSVWSVA